MHSNQSKTKLLKVMPTGVFYFIRCLLYYVHRQNNRFNILLIEVNIYSFNFFEE